MEFLATYSIFWKTFYGIGNKELFLMIRYLIGKIFM